MTEYLVENYDLVSALAITAKLNKLANEGWKLVHVAGDSGHLYVFTREAKRPACRGGNTTEYRGYPKWDWEQDDKGDLHQ